MKLTLLFISNSSFFDCLAINLKIYANNYFLLLFLSKLSTAFVAIGYNITCK